jgi:hypothetical protein
VIVQIVRFRSRLSDEQVHAKYQSRAAQYRAQPGLAQKYYLKYDNGEHGAVYFWESEEAMGRFRASELARTIPQAYEVEGTPAVSSATLVMTLRDSLPRLP